MTRAERIEAALRRLKYRDEPGEPDRYCDHAAEPCPRCEAVRAALAAPPEGVGRRYCNRYPCVIHPGVPDPACPDCRGNGWLPSAPPPVTPGCTGLTAGWCPVHGDCRCKPLGDGSPSLDDEACPLHSTASEHAQGSAPPPPVTDAGRCPVAGSSAATGTCFKCGVKVEPSPCHCGSMHTGVYCWPCHHKNVTSCGAPHCPEHGYEAMQKWLEEHGGTGRSQGQDGRKEGGGK